LLVAFTSVTASAAACHSEISIESDEWKLITVPCLNGQSLNEVFGVLGDRGVEWQVFSFDPKTNSYELPDIDLVLAPGSGFWVLQITGETLTLEVSSENANLRGTLSSGNRVSDVSRWEMAGNPFADSLNLHEIFVNVVTEDSAELISFALADESQQYVIFAYRNGGYSRLEPGDSLQPWEGFWAISPTTINVTQSVFKPTVLNPEVQVSANEYEQYTGQGVGSDTFGFYALLTLPSGSGPEIYAGLSGRPSRINGGAVIKKGADGTSFLASLDEQGVGRIQQMVGSIGIPGEDPCCASAVGDSGPGQYDHEWDWGNFYALDNVQGTMSKFRNLPNVVHGFGIFDNTPNDGNVYYAGSGHFADGQEIQNSTPTGLLFGSADSGNSWRKIADRYDGIGNFRTYDVVGNSSASQIYTVWNDEYDESLKNCGLALSIDGLQSWQRVDLPMVKCKSYSLFHGDSTLLVVSADADSIFAVSQTGFEEIPLPTGVKVSGAQGLAVDGAEILVLAQDRVLSTTSDHSDWKVRAIYPVDNEHFLSLSVSDGVAYVGTRAVQPKVLSESAM